MWITLKLDNNLTAINVFTQLRKHAGVYIERPVEGGDLYIGDSMNIQTDFSEEGKLTLKILVKPQIDG